MKLIYSEIYSDLVNLHLRLKNNSKMIYPNGKIGKKINLNNNKNSVSFKEIKILKRRNLKSSLKYLKIEIKTINNKIINNVKTNIKKFSIRIMKSSTISSIKKPKSLILILKLMSPIMD